MANKLSMQDTQFRSLGREDPLEKKMATHSSVFHLENRMDEGAWRAAVCRLVKESDRKDIQ